MTWKPTGHSTASPYLIVQDAEATLSFLESVFGATRLEVHPRSDGSGIVHAEAKIDDTVIMMGEMPHGVAAHVHVYVPDADATFARAIAAGGQVAQPVRLTEEGDHRGGVVDANGVTWWISTRGAATP